MEGCVTAVIDRLTLEKSEILKATRNCDVTGFIMITPEGDRVLIERSCVRWLSNEKFHAIMHPEATMVSFTTDASLEIDIERKLSHEFGFEIIQDDWGDGESNYFFGYSLAQVGDDEELDGDPLPFDTAVRCCGILKRHGINDFSIEENGAWAMSMIERTDFTGYETTQEDKKEWQRVAAIFWSEADPSRLCNMLPKWP